MKETAISKAHSAPTLVAAVLLAAATANAEPTITASDVADGFQAAGVVDGNRLSCVAGSVWKSVSGRGWWQIEFAEPRQVGALLQIHGDHEYRLQNAPRDYAWQWSRDGQSWADISETVVERETRLFRIHRLREPLRVAYLRLNILESSGGAAALREVEFFAATDAEIEFADWVVAVNSAEDRERHDVGTRFITLARQCEGWRDLPAQLVWHGEFDPAFIATEPRPMCAFLSGSFLEWCQRSREPWRGVQQVLKNRGLPLWAACGGAQALAILEETGVDHPWDCPRCRDARNPCLPVYSHIGHTGPAACGDYGNNLGERGTFKVRQVVNDPAFQGLPEVFDIMESHVGQIAYVPEGWTRVVAKGPGALTCNQCLRVQDYLIYAAQFHIEMDGTPENSRTIMTNFLRLAKMHANRLEEASAAH